MIVPISIDLSEVVEEFNLDEETSAQLGSHIIDRIAQEYDMRWNNLVDSKLKKSRSEYKRAMSISLTSINGVSEVEFKLSERISPIAMMVEEGKGPFDEKIGFERSDKVKQKKNGGWYLTIPFRWATPQAVADAGVFTNLMPKEIYNLVKRNGSIPKSKLPEQYQTIGKRKEISVPGLQVPEYMHKNSIYEGITRIPAASSSKEKRSNYFSFRRVSNLSDPGSWWNGGIEARDLMGKALQEAQIDKVADMAIDEFLQKLQL